MGDSRIVTGLVAVIIMLPMYFVVHFGFQSREDGTLQALTDKYGITSTSSELPIFTNRTVTDITINGPAGTKTCDISIGDNIENVFVSCDGTEYPRIEKS